MVNQEQYNKWFKSMLKKYPLNHSYDLINQSYDGIKYLDAKISHPNVEEKDIYLSTYGKELTISICETIGDRPQLNAHGNFALGNNRFQHEIAGMLGRRVAPAKPGRPRKKKGKRRSN